MATQIQIRRDTASNWSSTNPTLAAGEFGWESDTNKFKIGTGSAAWNSLGYASEGDTAGITFVGDDSTGTLVKQNETFKVTGTQNITAVVSGDTLTLTGPDLTSYLTASSSTTLTNKNIDADNNTVSNIEVDNLKSGVLDTDISSVAGTDTTLASAKAIKTYVDAQIATKDNTDEITEGSSNLYFTNARADARITNALKDEDNMASDSATHVPSQQSVKAYVDAQDANVASDSLTFTNKTIDANGTGNSITNLEVADLASGVLDTDISSVSASDNTLASAKAIKTYVDAQIATKDALSELSGDTDDVSEGSSNLYFTNARADARISNAIVDEDNMSSNSATQVPSQQSVKAYVDTEVAGVVDSAPSALNTLNELAAALGDDANFATTTSSALGNRLRIDVNNQGLTSTQKTNAATNLGLNTVATSGAYSDLSGTPTIPSNNNQLTNGAGFITDSNLTVVGDDSSGVTFSTKNNDNLKIAGGTNITTAVSGDTVTITGPDTSSFITGSSTTTLTNKTFDVEGTGNSISNIDVADLKSGVLDTDISSVSGSDDTLASAKAIKTYVDAQIATKDNTDEITEGSSNLYYTDARAQAVSINNVVEDTTPQLGGNLDLNGNNITGTGNITTTGQADIDFVTIKDNKITTNATNADLQISANGTGQIQISPNDASVDGVFSDNTRYDFGANRIFSEQDADANSIFSDSGDRRYANGDFVSVSLGSSSSNSHARWRSGTFSLVDMKGHDIDSSTNYFKGINTRYVETLIKNTSTSAASTLNNITGVYSSLNTEGTNNGGGLTINSGYGFVTDIALNEGTSETTAMTDAYHYAVKGSSGGGAITNEYGLHVDGLNGTNKYGVYVNDDAYQNKIGGLDIASKQISTTSNGDITLAPNGTGKTILKGNTNPGTLVFNCENNSHGQTVKAQPHSADVTNTLTLPAGGDQEIVGTAATQTLTNKTLTSPVLNTGVSGTAIKDEDNMSSNSATHLATQQSIKAYVDAEVSGAGGGGVTVQDEGSGLSTTATTLNFVGSGVTASGTGATKTITISGGGGSADTGDITFSGNELSTGSSNADLELSANGTGGITIAPNGIPADYQATFWSSASTVASRGAGLTNKFDFTDNTPVDQRSYQYYTTFRKLQQADTSSSQARFRQIFSNAVDYNGGDSTNTGSSRGVQTQFNAYAQNSDTSNKSTIGTMGGIKMYGGAGSEGNYNGDMDITNLTALSAVFEISTGSGQEIDVTNATSLKVDGYTYGSGTATLANQKGIDIYLTNSPTAESIGININHAPGGSPSGEVFDIRTLNDNKSSFSELLIGGESNGTDKVLKTATSNDNLNIATKGTGDITLKAGEDVTTLNSANDTASTVYADRFRHREAFYDNGNQGATFNPDINNGNVQQATLTNNITINNIQNIARGQSLTLILIQDSTGGRTLTIDNDFIKFASGVKTLTTTANAIDVLSIFYTGSTYIGSLSTNFV